MATHYAPVTPSVLEWARLSIGVDAETAASRARVTVERLQEWESGAAEPTVAKLRQLAKLYQRPLAVFFLPEPPADFDTPRDFCKLPGRPERSWSRALHKVYRRAVFQQEVASDLREEEGEPPHSVPALDIAQRPEAAAVLAREALGVSLAQQFSWTRPQDAFRGWLEAVESLGVLVLRTSQVSVDEMRGFALGPDTVPVVVVNALDAPRAQAFTLLHELAHLMLREGGVCGTVEPDRGEASRIERWCNAVAAAALVPAESILADEAVGPSGRREWDDDVLARLSGKYQVSREAILLRLLDLRRTTRDFYLKRREDFRFAYAQQREHERERRPKPKGGPPPHRMALRDHGRPYVQLVLDAYHRDSLTLSSATLLLDLKGKHLPDLERELISSS